MSDQMKFPDTWENLKSILGSMILDNIKRKEQLRKNKMEQIATLFGKKLNEEFKVKRTIGDFYEVTVAFTSNGLFLRGKNAIEVNRMGVLEDLLTGEAMIVDA